MYTVALLALFAATEYACVEAASPQVTRRQSDTPVALWGACNYPSQGINGPLPCADGSQCICKDDTYSQCRTQTDGSWAPDPSWQCQQPGGSGSGSSSGGSPASNPSGSSGSGTPASSPSDTSGGSNSQGDSSTPATGSDSTSQRVGGGQTNANQLASSGSGGGGISSSGTQPNVDQDASTGGTSGSQAATIGGCDAASPPSGFDGAASTSFYGWMGSACQCGQAAWQWSSSPGLYNAAVNQRLFNGKLNGAGQPNCGSACGQCYELSTSGFNAYNDGVASGSTITVQIVDACYSSGDHWCGSTSDDYKDSSGCGVHFDIQTGPPQSNGVAPVGADGKTWNGGGQIVYYRPTACPQTLSSNYQGCTC